MSSTGGKQSALIEELVHYGESAFDPAVPLANRLQHIENFNAFVERTKIMALLPALTTLVQPGRVQDWLRPHLMRTLAMLPLRPRGVRNVIEFIVSIHPTTAPPVSTKGATAETRGPSISLEALASASKLISSPPSGMSPDTWFAGIAPQLLELLDGQGGLEMVKASSYIIGYGILGRREYGAPGSPGWKAFAAPLIGCIDPNYRHEALLEPAKSSNSPDDIIGLSARNVLVSSSELAEALRRLASLLSSHPNPGLLRRLLGNLLLPLWAIASWPAKGTELEEWRAPATYLLQILLQLSDDGNFFSITQNLMFRGKRDKDHIAWIYKPASPDGIQIERWLDDDGQSELISLEDLEVLDRKVDTFVALLQPARDERLVASLFLFLCKQWLLNKDQSQPEIVIASSLKEESSDSSMQQLIGGKIMQKMMTTMPGLLVGDSNQVLELAGEVLRRYVNTGEDLQRDETVPIALSLLNLVFTSTHFQAAREAPIMSSVKDSLMRIARKSNSDISTTAQNLLYLLEYQDTEVPTRADPAVDRHDEDRRIYKLAMSYLMSTESPPPVRAQGLDLLCDLMRSNSPVLDIPATLILLASLLRDEEEYIYLRCIKAYIQLSERHLKTVIENLLERYVDANEEAILDARLRVGEALLQVIERSGKMFQGSVAQEVGGALLSIAGRRGDRPKAEHARRKREAASQKKTLEAEKAWDGPVPQLDEEEQEDQGEGYEVLQQIVEGWESKRGEEDVRMRASALAILGTAIEVNVAGLGSSLASSAIDLSINILALEKEPEKAILRRAAILLIMSLIRALDQTSPGFGFAGQNLDDVLRILRYIESTDNDGLVRHHAKDVIEGLETWQMKSLLEARKPQSSSSLGENLADLSLGAASSSERKPRIEEIE